MAEEFKSGPKPGDEVGAFEVKKVTGAPEDGVAVGEQLCYRCRLGNRPVVMVFARAADKDLAALIKELDKTVARHSEQKMASFVNLMADKGEEIAKGAEKVIKDTEVENVAVVAPVDQAGTEKQFGLNKEAKLTVVIYNEGVVKATHAIPAKGEVKKELLAQIVKESEEMVN
jgi:hypothetical protein